MAHPEMYFSIFKRTNVITNLEYKKDRTSCTISILALDSIVIVYTYYYYYYIPGRKDFDLCIFGSLGESACGAKTLV